MPITQTTPMSEIAASLRKGVEDVIRAVAYRLSAIGEEVVNHARSLPSPPKEMKGKPHKPNYIDWSSNLRSSIGYVISVNGRIYGQGGFEPEKGGDKGAKQGAAFAKRLVSQYPKGICLIVVAGMRYATYVSAKGYDVLDSSELLADQLVPRMLRRLVLIK